MLRLWLLLGQTRRRVQGLLTLIQGLLLLLLVLRGVVIVVISIVMYLGSLYLIIFCKLRLSIFAILLVFLLNIFANYFLLLGHNTERLPRRLCMLLENNLRLLKALADPIVLEPSLPLS